MNNPSIQMGGNTSSTAIDTASRPLPDFTRNKYALLFSPEQAPRLDMHAPVQLDAETGIAIDAVAFHVKRTLPWDKMRDAVEMYKLGQIESQVLDALDEYEHEQKQARRQKMSAFIASMRHHS